MRARAHEALSNALANPGRTEARVARPRQQKQLNGLVNLFQYPLKTRIGKCILVAVQAGLSPPRNNSQVR